MRWKQVVSALCVVVGLGVGGAWLIRAQAGEPVDIPDPALQRAIRFAIAKYEGTLTNKDLALVQSLDSEGKPIESLEGIQHCANLESADFEGSFAGPSPGCIVGYHPELDRVDLTPLTGLTQLKTLNLAKCELGDLSALAGLSALEVLNLEWNYPTSLKPLVQLARLRELSLNGSYVAEGYAPLAELKSLRILDLRLGDSAHLESLALLPNLEEVRLDLNGSSDISPLLSCPSLRTFYLSDFSYGGAPEFDLTQVTRFSHLRELHFDAPEIDDLAFLAPLQELEVLELDANRIEGLTSLGLKPRLRSLSLARHSLDFDPPQSSFALPSVASLAGYTTLRELRVGTHESTDLSPLAKLMELEVLEIQMPGGDSGTWLTELPALRELSLRSLGRLELTTFARCAEVTTLSLPVSALLDLAPLAQMPELNTLSLTGSPDLPDLAPLGESQSLISLSLRSGETVDFKGVSAITTLESLTTPGFYQSHGALDEVGDLPNLTTLHLEGPLDDPDLAPLTRLSKLEHLTLTASDLKDISWVPQLRRLEFVDLSANPIDTHGREVVIPNLEAHGVRVTVRYFAAPRP